MPVGLTKKTVADVWPVRNKRVMVITDPVAIRDEGEDGDAMKTIKTLVSKGGRVVVAVSDGNISGIPMNARGKEVLLAAFKEEEGRGYTNYFAALTPSEKMQALTLCKTALPPTCAATRFSGKTIFFTSLPLSERAAIATTFAAEHKADVEFEPRCTTSIQTLIQQSLGSAVKFAADPLGAGESVDAMKAGDVLVLQNLRVYAGESSARLEERNDFAKVLASYCDVVVNDAFRISHEELASTTCLPRITRHCAAGSLMEKELSYFARLASNPARPLAVVIGGTDISGKLELLEHLVGRVDRIFLGGRFALPFLQASGVPVGKSAVAHSHVEVAAHIMRNAARSGSTLILPTDLVIQGPAGIPYVAACVPEDAEVVDVGPKTLRCYFLELQRCRSLFWLGTLGQSVDETSQTAHFARTVASSNLLSVVAGTNTCQVVRSLGLSTDITHLCSGGVVALHMLHSGDLLPGVDALSDSYTPADTKSVASVSDILRTLPMFKGCDSNVLGVLSKKSIRRAHSAGDVLVYNGDRQLHLWVVAQGSLTAARQGATGVTVAHRLIATGGSFGQYSFLSQSVSQDTVWATSNSTVTYQLSAKAVREAFLECPTTSQQLLWNLSHTLNSVTQSEQDWESSDLGCLTKDLMTTRVPTSARETLTPVGDLLVDVGARVTVAGFNALVSKQSITAISVGMVGLDAAVRSTLYHHIIKHTSRGAGDVAAVCIAAAGSGLISQTLLHCHLGLSKALAKGSAAVVPSLFPLACHLLFLRWRSAVEAIRTERATALIKPLGEPGSLILASLSRSFVATFLYAFSALGNGVPISPHQLLLTALKNVLAMVCRFVARKVAKRSAPSLTLQ